MPARAGEVLPPPPPGPPAAAYSETAEGLLEYSLDLSCGGKWPGRSLQVISDPLGVLQGHSLGSGLWTAAVKLVDFLADYDFRGQRVLELGAGLGALGQALALQGAAACTLTDRPQALPLLRRNIAANFPSPGAGPSCEALVWGEELPPALAEQRWDWLVGSDLCYDEECFEPLIATILALAARNPGMKVVLAIVDRPEAAPFFGRLSARSVAWRPLHRIPAGPGEPSSGVTLAQLVPPQAAPRTLFACDFDWSLLEENSDVFVLREVGALRQFEALRPRHPEWPSLMTAALAAAQSECGATREALTRALHAAPLHPDIRGAVQELAARPAADLHVLSDANAFFVGEILGRQGLGGCFRGVHTNGARWTPQGALAVDPAFPQGHACALCPPNICKGQILERLLMERTYTRVVYLGDGRNDFCPCTRLGPGDVVLGREAYPPGEAPGGAPCPLAGLLRSAGCSPLPRGPLCSAEEKQSTYGGEVGGEGQEGGSGMRGKAVGEEGQCSEGGGREVEAKREAEEEGGPKLKWPAAQVHASWRAWRRPSEAAALLLESGSVRK